MKLNETQKVPVVCPFLTQPLRGNIWILRKELYDSIQFYLPSPWGRIISLFHVSLLQLLLSDFALLPGSMKNDLWFITWLAKLPLIPPQPWVKQSSKETNSRSWIAGQMSLNDSKLLPERFHVNWQMAEGLNVLESLIRLPPLYLKPELHFWDLHNGRKDCLQKIITFWNIQKSLILNNHSICFSQAWVI